MDFKELLNEIRNNPKKYLGEDINLKKMNLFIDGYYSYYLSQCKSPDFYLEKQFTVYLKIKYNALISLNCFSLVDFFNKNKEEAFTIFFEEWDKFLQLSDEEIENLSIDEMIEKLRERK